MELKILMFFFQNVFFQTFLFCAAFVFGAHKFLGCRNYAGMKILEKEQKNGRFHSYFVIPCLEKEIFF